MRTWVVAIQTGLKWSGIGDLDEANVLIAAARDGIYITEANILVVAIGDRRGLTEVYFLILVI